LREIGTEVGVASYLIADGSELNPAWLKDARAVGITAGASAPEVLVDDVIETLRRIGPVAVSVLPGREENIEFRLPAELTAVDPPSSRCDAQRENSKWPFRFLKK
jgi:4-hydroxy-3-methylbut-2-enyl diphosphate reductase